MIDIMLGVLCEVRSAAHYDEHGGLRADSAYHVAHGERPTCDSSDGSPNHESSDDSNDPGVWRRKDDLGFHCTWRGCG